MALSVCGVMDQNIRETRDWTDTSKNEWPWIVQFEVAMQGWYAHGVKIWGVLGIILNERWLITAGHSLEKDGFYKITTNDGEVIDTAEIVPYSRCNVRETKCKNDIALVKLSKPIKFTNNVRPICIPDHATQLTFLQNRSEPAMILNDADTSNLHKRTVRVQRPGNNCNHFSFSNHMICAGLLRGACSGDTGSPLMFTREVQKGKYIAYLGGVLSWGTDILHENEEGELDIEKCKSDPTFLAYTNIAKKLKWIKDKTGITPGV